MVGALHAGPEGLIDQGLAGGTQPESTGGARASADGLDLTWIEPYSGGPVSRTFRAQALEDAFTRDGYVVLPFLRPADVAHLRAVFDRLYPTRRSDFESTALNESDDEHHLTAHDAIAPWFESRLAELFVDHDLVKGFFT